jgi:hypothetical protein
LFFRDCHRARSELVHGGQTSFDLLTHTTTLEQLIGTLLARVAGVNSPGHG